MGVSQEPNQERNQVRSRALNQDQSPVQSRVPSQVRNPVPNQVRNPVPSQVRNPVPSQEPNLEAKERRDIIMVTAVQEKSMFRMENCSQEHLLRQPKRHGQMNESMRWWCS